LGTYQAEHFQELTVHRGDRGGPRCTDAVGSENSAGTIKYIFFYCYRVGKYTLYLRFRGTSTTGATAGK